MGYVDRNLMPNEQVVSRAHLHWLIFLPALSWLAIAIATIVASSFFEGVIGWAVWVVGLAFLFFTFTKGVSAGLRWWSSEFAVTSKRLVVKVGLVRRSTLELLLAKVEAVGVNQSILGRLFGYGTLVITGTGGSMNSYDCIGSPLAFRQKVQQQIGNVQDTRS